jgi:hypothetical protein
LAFFVYFSILLRVINFLNNIFKEIAKLGDEILIFILKLLQGNLLLASYAINDNDEISNNINYFSNENNPENNEGSNSNSTNNSNSAAEGNNPENNEGSNSNPNNNSDSDSEEKNKDAMEVDDNDSNSNNDSSDSDDPENIEEVEDPEHNAPERIMDDLDMVDKARNNDPEALEYLKGEYGHFFNDTSKDEALNQIEGYLEEEFPKELKRSEHEADALKAKENAEDIEKEIDELEKEEKETTDPQIKENLSKGIGALKERAQEEREKAEKSNTKSY